MSQNVNIEHEMRKSYLEYSLSVIIGRAIPDVRDGLKPVHRRILFAQQELAKGDLMFAHFCSNPNSGPVPPCSAQNCHCKQEDADN